MKKSLLATTLVAFPLSTKTTRLRTYGCIAIVLLAACTATQTRWDATNIRKEVMVYYNDQIMDNLISAKNHRPFVHVDITLLTSQGASQITGTIGAGENRTNTNASKSMAGMLGTITNAVTRPFAWSVSPQQTETLSIQAAPALGSQAIASMSRPMTTTKETDETDITTKKTDETDAKTKEAAEPSATATPTPTSTATDAKTETTTKKVTKEKTPTPVTIYKLIKTSLTVMLKSV